MEHEHQFKLITDYQASPQAMQEEKRGHVYECYECRVFAFNASKDSNKHHSEGKLKKKQSLNDWEVASVLMFPVNYQEMKF